MEYMSSLLLGQFTKNQVEIKGICIIGMIMWTSNIDIDIMHSVYVFS